jgi:hypothetical protein
MAKVVKTFRIDADDWTAFTDQCREAESDPATVVARIVRDWSLAARRTSGAPRLKSEKGGEDK